MPLMAHAARAVVVETAVVVFVAALLAGAGFEHSGTAIGLLFLGVCHVRSWRFDDARVRADGLSLAGLAAPVLEPRRAFLVSLRAIVVALALVFPPFVAAWVFVQRPAEPFEASRALRELQPLAEVIVVALPEEAFFRGYVQSRLGEAFVGARGLGPVTAANLVTSLLFAAGHFGTSVSVARASVFFPSLLFGLLRERTGGIVAPVIVHALSNLLARVLFAGFGIP
jgi:membrane protease YdiL (CAAX protease family)